MTTNATSDPPAAPASEFYVTGGTLSRDAACYVMRQADADLLEGLRQGAFCYVLTSRQMGKSSLMVRTATKLRQEGIAVAVLDLTAIGQNLTPEQWYDGLLSRVGRQLDLEDELEDFWLDHERLAPLPRFMQALRQIVLNHVPGRVVLFIDEIDAVLSLPFSTDEFFAAIRETYNARSEDPELSRLVFGLFGVAAPSDLIRDTRTTPFNIGKRIELKDFTLEEALPLAQGLNAGGEGAALLKRILYWTGGHPYLTQRFCLTVAESSEPIRVLEVDRVCSDLFLSSRARERDVNLLDVRNQLLRSDVDRASLLDKYGRILSRRPVADDETDPLVTVLRLCGVTRAEQGRLQVRNRIYSEVFDRKWVLANMPDAELRRQREAFRRGIRRAVAVSSLVVVALLALSGFALHNAKQARAASRREQKANQNLKKANQQLTQAYAQKEEQRQKAIASASSERKAKKRAQDEAQKKQNALQQARNSQERAQREKQAAENASHRAKDSERKEKIAKSAAQKNLRDARMSLYPASLARAQKSIEEGDQSGAWKLLQPFANPQLSGVGQPGFEWHYLSRLCRSDASTILPKHGDAVYALAWSPNGHLLATASGQGNKERNSTTCVLRLWEARTGRLLRTIPMGLHRIDSLAFSPDNSQLAAGEYIRLSVWNLAKGLPKITDKPDFIRTKSPGGGPMEDMTAIAFSPDGKWLVGGGGSSRLYLWDAKKLTLHGYADYAQRNYNMHCLAFSSDSSQIVAGYSTDDGALQTRLWSVPSLTQGAAVSDSARGHHHYVYGVAWSPDRKWIATAGDDGVVKVWQVGTNHMFSLTDHQSPVWRVAFSPDGKFMASGDDNGIVILWDASGLAAGKPPVQVAALRGHSKAVRALEFSPNGKRLASGSGDETVRIWSLANVHQPMLRGHTNSIISIDVTPDGKTIVTAAADKKVCLWDANTHKLRGTMAPSSLPLRIALAPDGHRLAVAGFDPSTASVGFLRLWDITTQRKLSDFPGNQKGTLAEQNGILALAWSSDGHRLAAGTKQPDSNNAFPTLLWNADTRRKPRPMFAHLGWVRCLAFVPNSSIVVSGDTAGNVVWWDSVTQKELPIPDDPPGQSRQSSRYPHQGEVSAIVFSPDGSLMASAGVDKTIRLWDVKNRQVLLTLRGHTKAINALAFSPDGKTLASGGEESEIQLWTLSTRSVGLVQNAVHLTTNESAVTALAFTLDGSTLLSGHTSGNVLLWQASSVSTIAHIPQKRSGIVIR